MFQAVLAFWFEELSPEDWFRKDPALDATIRDRFADTHSAAFAGECYRWREQPIGRLAEIIVLDQFSRNLFRDSAASFAADGMALALAQEAIANGADEALTPNQKQFLYMPFMHSESRTIHELAADLFSAPGLENTLRFEQAHKRIIDRFGRYPHRNDLLGRTSTSEELAFLATDESSF